MDWRELLLEELDHEMKSTRRVLERVPLERADFAPHGKSTKLGDLATHVARLAGYGAMVMNTPELDFATADRSAWAAVSDREQLLALFDSGAAATRAAIAEAPEEKYDHSWKLRMGDKVFFSESRPMTLRVFMMNHIIHHRAQLGVYLRMLDVPVPGTYGPSADEPI